MLACTDLCLSCPLSSKQNSQGSKPVEIVVEEKAPSDDEATTCTFDDDADPSIERCWNVEGGGAAAGVGGAAKGNFTLSDAPWPLSLWNEVDSEDPANMMFGGIAVTVFLIYVFSRLFHKTPPPPSDDGPQGEAQERGQGAKGGASKKGGKKLVDDDSDGPSTTTRNAPGAEVRLKDLRLRLEKETKEKQGLSEQNNALKSALEERKATVQMFTSELQVSKRSNSKNLYRFVLIDKRFWIYNSTSSFFKSLLLL